MDLESLEIRSIRHGTSEYDQEVALRMEILRKPLGLEFSPEDLKRENGDFHLGAFFEKKLVGCLFLSPMSEGKIKMRQVAVNMPGLGIGRRLVDASELLAKARGFSEMELSARETAVPFYLKLGYRIMSEPFIEVCLPHRKMRKELV